MPSRKVEKSDEANKSPENRKIEKLLRAKEIDPQEIIESLYSDNWSWIISVQDYLSEGNGTVSLKGIEGYGEAVRDCFEQLLKKGCIDEAVKCKEKLGEGMDFTEEIKAIAQLHLKNRSNGIAAEIIEKFGNGIDLTEVALLATRKRIKKELGRMSNYYAKCGLKVDPADIKKTVLSAAREWEKETKSNGDKS